MADDLIDFSELENDENCCPDEDLENRAPKLVQSPVIVNPILKQSTKDNLIQLYTPVQRPVKGKLKVTFGEDSVLQTPIVKKAEKRTVKSDVTIEEVKQEQTAEDKEKQEREDWEERTSILTSIDHQDYTGYARDFIEEIIQSIPIKEDSPHSVDSGVESMDCCDYEAEPIHFPVNSDINQNCADDNAEAEMSFTTSILSYATDLLKSLQQENKSQDTNLTDLHMAKESETAAESEEEFMDCEEYMDVDSGELTVPQNKEIVPNSRETVPENTETVPPNNDTVTQNNETVKPNRATVAQNDETVPQSKEKVPENKETPPQNTETLTQNYETVPQNSSIVPPNNKAVEQNNEPEQQNKETVLQNNETVQQNTKTEPHNETLPQNSETVPHNNVTDITATNSMLEITDDGTRTTAEMKTISEPALNNACEVRSAIEANFAGESSGENNKTNIENNVQTSNAENKQDINSIGNDMHEEKVSLKANCTDKQSETVDDVSGKQKSKENADKEAISDDQTNEAHIKDIPASNIEEQPILPKKGFYNLDELDLESMDPFKPKTQISNTPDKTSQVKALSVDNEEQDVNMGTCMVSSKINPPDKSDEKIDLKDTIATSGMDKVILPESEVVVVTQNDNTPDKTEECKQREIQKEAQNEMSSDEIQSLDKNPEENIFATSTEEEPILPKKGVYNLDELDFESMDPFKPKTQIVNTPDKSDQGKTVMVGQGENTCDRRGKSQKGEIKNEGQTQVSCDTTQDSAKSPNMDVDVCTTNKSLKRQEQNSSEKLLMETEDNFQGMLDPFRPRKQMQNSPVMPNKTVGKSELVSADMSVECELKETCVTENSTADTSDITKVSIHPQNSPITQDQVTEESKEENMKESSQISKALEKVQDSEPGPKDAQDFAEITDPFKPRKQMQNSPVVKGAATSAINFDEIEDPFKPSKQMQNSPSVNTENDAEDVLNGDDFNVVKKQDKNSTVAKDLNTKLEDIEDPFKPNNQMLNSPVIKQKVLESGTDSQDAFKTNSKLTSSPLSVKLNTKDCNDTETGAKLQGDMNNSNKNQDSNLDLLEMPSLDGIENPFKPSKQMQNSPLSKQNIEADSERKNIVNGSQPIVPKDKSQTESIADPKFDAFDDIDPFKTYRQIPQTPDKDQVETSGKDENNESTEETPKVEKMDGMCSAETEVKTPTNKENKQTIRGTGATDTVEPEEEDDNCFEITNVTRRGDLPKDARVGNFDGLSIDESQFVSAAQVFNEPGMLDLLEQFGDTSSKQQESSLSRMSLYVKFDPLVEAAPNPRRISIRPDQLEKMREYGLDETLLLLGTPPKKKRQSLSVSFLKNTPDSRLLLDRKREPARVQPGEVDMILACSPDEKKEETPACSNIPPFSSLVEDIAAADTGIFEELKYTETDLKKVKNGLKMEMEGILLEKKREFYAKEQALNKEREKFETVNSELKRKCVTLEENNTKLNGVMKMYEQTFVDVAEKHKAELQKVEQEKTKIKEERDSVMNDNLSVEKAFTELHARYDKLKNIIDGLKKNDEAMKKYVSECQENITAKDKKLGTMKKSYEEKCKQLQQENEKLKQQYDESVSKSEARAKVSQMKIESLEKQLEQKMAENKELAEICDKLLAVQQDS